MCSSALCPPFAFRPQLPVYVAAGLVRHSRPHAHAFLTFTVHKAKAPPHVFKEATPVPPSSRCALLTFHAVGLETYALFSVGLDATVARHSRANPTGKAGSEGEENSPERNAIGGQILRCRSSRAPQPNASAETGKGRLPTRGCGETAHVNRLR